MLEQEVALRALAAIDTLVVSQHVLDLVQAGRVVSTVLAAIAAHNLHAQAALHHLALVAVLEAHVLGGAARVVLELPALVGALCVDLYNGAPGPGVVTDICIGSKGIVDGHITQRV